MEGVTNNMVSETPVLRDARLAELKAILELRTKLIIEALDEGFAAQNAKWDARFGARTSSGSGVLGDMAAATEELVHKEPNDCTTACINGVHFDRTNATTPASSNNSTASSSPVLLPTMSISITMELVVDPVLDAAAPSALYIEHSGVVIDAPATCSTKYPSCVVNDMAPAEACTINKEIALYAANAAAPLSGLDVECSNVNFNTPTNCSTKCPGRVICAMPLAEVHHNKAISCGGDLINLYDFNLHDAPIVFERCCDEILGTSLWFMLNCGEQQPWPPHTQLKHEQSGSFQGPQPWPSFSMDCNSSGNTELWLWKPPWPYLPWPNVICFSAAEVMEFLKVITVISRNVGSVAVAVLADLCTIIPVTMCELLSWLGCDLIGLPVGCVMMVIVGFSCLRHVS